MLARRLRRRPNIKPAFVLKSRVCWDLGYSGITHHSLYYQKTTVTAAPYSDRHGDIKPPNMGS